MWLKLPNGNFVNTAQARSIYAVNDSGTWYLEVDVAGSGVRLNGSWASEADAQEAARELVQPVDPGTYGD
jgi:hypothetical protein